MEANQTLRPGDLPVEWRQRAQLLSDYGDPNAARLWQIAAAELDANANRRSVSTTLSMAPAIESTTGKDVATKKVAATIVP